MKDYFISADERNYQWIAGVKKGTKDETFREYAVMKHMRWSWEDLMNIPEEMYLSMVRIMSIETEHREKEANKK